MTFDQHLKLVAGIHIVLAVFGLLGAGFMLLLFVGAGMASGEADAFFISGTVGMLVAAFLAVTALPGLIGGMGILKGKNWARILLLIVSAFLVFHVPLGTLAAIYTFWTLLRAEAAERFTPGAAARAGGGSTADLAGGGQPGAPGPANR